MCSPWARREQCTGLLLPLLPLQCNGLFLSHAAFRPESHNAAQLNCGTTVVPANVERIRMPVLVCRTLSPSLWLPRLGTRVCVLGLFLVDVMTSLSDSRVCCVCLAPLSGLARSIGPPLARTQMLVSAAAVSRIRARRPQ